MSLLLDYFKKSQIRQKNQLLFTNPDVEIHKQNRSCGDDCRVRLRFSKPSLSPVPQDVSDSGSAEMESPSESGDGSKPDRMGLEACGTDLQIESSGCAVHLASSEIARELCLYLNKADGLKLVIAVIDRLEHRQVSIVNGSERSSEKAEQIDRHIQDILGDPRIVALFELKDHPVRKKCVLLGWQTLYEALGQPAH